MPTEEFTLPRETVIGQLIENLIIERANEQRYAHRPSGSYHEGRSSGLTTALFFTADVSHERVELLVERYVERGLTPLDDAGIQQLLADVRAEVLLKPDVSIDSL